MRQRSGSTVSFEYVACGEARQQAEEELNIKRTTGEPEAYFDEALNTVSSKPVDDGSITGPGGIPDKLLALLGNSFVLDVWEVGGGVTYLGRHLRDIDGGYALRPRDDISGKLLDRRRQQWSLPP